jgi:hypothetical protein
LARPKEDLSKLTINQLETLTGMTFRSIKKYLSEGNLDPAETTDNCVFYNSKDALKILFNALSERDGNWVKVDENTPEAQLEKILDPDIQKARKDRAQANKAEFELAVLKKKFMPADEVEKGWADMVTNFRIKMLSLAPTLAPTLFAIKEIRDFEKKWDEINRETLQELSEYAVRDDENPG